MATTEPTDRTTQRWPALAPPERLLAGPGPSNVDPRVVAAMARPMIGHLDPVFRDVLADLSRMVAATYRAPDGASLVLSQSGSSGMETGIVNLVDPGDMVIAASAGYFGNRIIQMLERRGARVVALTEPFGRYVGNDRILDALEKHPDATMVCVVYAETSTGVRHPLEQLGEAMRAVGSEALLFADCVTALGGIPLEVGAWNVDYAYSCSQKCLAAPPGLSPITLSERGLARLGRDGAAPVPYVLDLKLLQTMWFADTVAYHHTTPNLQYYALHEALRLSLEEGHQQRWERHADAGGYLQEGFRARGLSLLADPAAQLPQLTAVIVPDGVDGPTVQRALLERHGIEVGGGLGPDAPPIWRIGMMGVNATRETADRVLAAFDDVMK